MSSSSVYAKDDWGKVLGIGWCWLLRPDHVLLCNIENHYLKHVKGIKDIIGEVIEMQKSVRVK